MPYFILGGIYDSLPQYPEPHKIIGFCNYVPQIMNSTDLCPNGLHPDGSYVIYQLLLVINPQISKNMAGAMAAPQIDVMSKSV